MSREDGFSIADVDTSMLDDPKFRTLWRRLRGRAAMGQAVTVYLAAILESWRSGERSTADDAAPTWLGDVSGTVAALSAVGLLDEGGKVPEHAWLSWFVPAFDRREARRAAGSIGGQHKASNARALLQQSPSDALPVPSLPSVPTKGTDTRASAWDGYGPEWDAFKVATEGRGFRKPPTPKQRAILWPIVEARPADAARWASETPGDVKFSVVVGHILKAWDAFRASTPETRPAGTSDFDRRCAETSALIASQTPTKETEKQRQQRISATPMPVSVPWPGLTAAPVTPA